MFIFESFIEILFYNVCGFMGHAVVRIVTAGKIKIEWGSGSGSVITEWLGVLFLLIFGGSVVWLFKS